MSGDHLIGRGDVAIIMPVYNESTVVADVIRDVRLRFPRTVCVDDGSTDGSPQAIVRAGGQLVRHPVNLGQGAALQTGLTFALLDPGVRVVATFDADGQHDPDDVVAMVDLLERDSLDVVFGSRFLDDRTELGRAKRTVLSVAAAYSRWSTGLALTDAHNGLRVFTRSAAERLRITQNGMAHASEIVSQVARLQLRYAEAPVHIRYTDYSKAKGQPLLNGVNILFDLMFR